MAEKIDYSKGIYDAKQLGTPKLLILGAQHMFAMFGATVLVPLLTGLSVSTTLLCAGLGTLLFHFLCKGKVPAFLGSSFAYLGGFTIVTNGGANTENLPYAMGLAAAATRLAKTMKSRDAAVRALNLRLREGLKAFPEVEINSPAGAVPEVLNFSENCIKSETMLAWLSEKQIYVSSASACGRGQPSHTLAAMGRDPLAIDTAIRVSFCADNTPEDVDAFLERFEDGMKHLQRIKK